MLQQSQRHDIERIQAVDAAYLFGDDDGIQPELAEIRRRVCERLQWLGVALDDTANGTGARRISTPASTVATLVIPTDEEIVLAEGAAALLRPAD